MNDGEHATVIFADVVHSRREAGVASAWLATLVVELEDEFAGEVLAPFEFTQGDELQGLIAPGADPFRGVTRGALHPKAMPMRWVVRAGGVDPGRGPATRRTGEAFIEARRMIDAARRQREWLVAETGDPRVDLLLGDVAPVCGEMLYALRDRQRTIAWLELVEGRRRSDIARQLGIARATVSVSARRGHLRSVARLLDACARLYTEGAAT